MDPQKRRQMGDELLIRAAALRLLGRALAEEVSQSADRIAQTMDDVARVQDAIATNGVDTTAAHVREHTEHAERARRFAQHERTEQHRWSNIAHND